MGYLDAQEGDSARTAFRKAEKHYKLYKSASTGSSKHKEVPPTDLSKVLDFRKDDIDLVPGVRRLDGDFGSPVFVLDRHPGFYFIPEAVNLHEQFYWIKEALTTFPEPPNRTSHTAQYGPVYDLWPAVENNRVLIENTESTISTTETRAEFCLPAAPDGGPQPRFHSSGGHADLFQQKWRFVDAIKESSNSKVVSAKKFLRKLRWATLGIQFDWSKRAYDISLPYRKFPLKLAKLATELAAPAMNGDVFNAEAAIINFFGAEDMLGGHIDDMEADWSKPIVSISLGCKAVFLLGGESRDEAPTAMFLRSGDAVLMVGPARSCFHGVPRILVNKDSDSPDFCAVADVSDDHILEYMRESRININIRQVF